MKKIILSMLLIVAVCALGCGGSNTTAQTKTEDTKAQMAAANSAAPTGALPSLKDKKVLIAYFSWSGNTRKLAQNIQKKTGGHMFEMEVEKPYPTDYKETVNQAKAEAGNGARPALKNKVDNFAQYDVIFLGFPNWWGSAPMPVQTFMASYDWKGKTVVPFFTHGGGGVQSCNTAVVDALGGAKVLPYLCLRGEDADSAGEIDKWLGELKF